MTTEPKQPTAIDTIAAGDKIDSQRSGPLRFPIDDRRMRDFISTMYWHLGD